MQSVAGISTSIARDADTKDVKEARETNGEAREANAIATEPNGLARDVSAKILKDFKKYKFRGENWEKIKDKNLVEVNTDESIRELKKLVEYRDIIDYYLFLEAIERIFPEHYYIVETELDGKIMEKNGKLEAVNTWFNFIIKRKAPYDVAKGKSSKNSYITIKINAPGSRTVTSDVDTSIAVKIEGEPEVLREYVNQDYAKNIKKGLDFSGRIRNAVIHGFYSLSEEEFEMTSGEHRDSNVYAELPDTENYPKFKLEFKPDTDNNPLIDGQWLFSGKDKDEFGEALSKYKEEKHHLEMAASLFSLRVALDDDISSVSNDGKRVASGSKAWNEFRETIFKAIKDASERLEDGTKPGKEQADKYEKLSKKDIECIFAKVEELFGHYKKELNRKTSEVVEEFNKPKKGARKNAVQEFDKAKNEAVAAAAATAGASAGAAKVQRDKVQGEMGERNLMVAALNRLYFEHLEKMSDIQDDLLALERNKEGSLKRALEILDGDDGVKELDKLLKAYQANPVVFKKQLAEHEKVCGFKNKEYADALQALRVIIRKINKLKMEKLTARYKASLFANEAYVCRSAVYHVVEGMQQKNEEIDRKITEKVLLSSLLQQVGFRILHEQDLTKRQKHEQDLTDRDRERLKGAIVYRVAKYSKRIHHLLFKKADIQDEEITAAFTRRGNNRLGILGRLRSLEWKEHFFRVFTSEELLLLNFETNKILKLKDSDSREPEKYDQAAGFLQDFKKMLVQIFQKKLVKFKDKAKLKDSDLRDSKQYDENMRLLQERSVQPQPLFLSIAAKVVSGVYLSKYTEQGSLWGRRGHPKEQADVAAPTLAGAGAAAAVVQQSLLNQGQRKEQADIVAVASASAAAGAGAGAAAAEVARNAANPEDINVKNFSTPAKIDLEGFGTNINVDGGNATQGLKAVAVGSRMTPEQMAAIEKIRAARRR